MTVCKNYTSQETARILCKVELERLLGEYGAIRLAKRLLPTLKGDDLLVISPAIVPLAAPRPVAPVTVLDSGLYRLAELGYGDMQTAAHEVRAECGSYHFTDCGKGVK